MIKKNKRFEQLCSLAIPIFALLLVSCSSEGIDRQVGPRPDLPTAVLSDAVELAPGATSLGPVINPGPSRFVHLEKLNFEASLPSVISLLFKTTDRYGNAVAGLGTSDFQLLDTENRHYD